MCVDIACYPISYSCPGHEFRAFLFTRKPHVLPPPLCVGFQPFRLGRRTIRPHPDHSGARSHLERRARAPEAMAAKAEVGCLGVVVVWRAELSCERELACSCCAAPNTKPVLPLASLSVLSTSGVPHRSSLGGLSGPEVRRDTSGASGCVEGPQARALAPAHPDALPSVPSCWGPSSSKKESHPEPQILTTSYHDTVPSRADSPNGPSPWPT